MRHLAIGDIHGCFRALRALEAFVPFRPDDALITLGDYVDRGPNSCAVLDWLIARRAGGDLVQKSGVPRNLGHAVCIGTGAYKGGGWLTCLDVATGRYWQANERGHTRDGWLD